jgi:spermidine/putrescine transport system substrate-binding protein
MLTPDDRLSRRDLLGRAGGLGLGLSASAVLAACGGVKGAEQSARPVHAVRHPRTRIGVLNFSNWPLYVDKGILAQWDRRTGGHVHYVEEINDNEEFFAKVREQLKRGQSIGRDLLPLTDWMVTRWIRFGYVEPIDKRNVPNAKNLVPELRHPQWDPHRRFTLPWQSGITGIAYNRRKIGREVRSINELFDPRYKGRVSFFSDARDTSHLTMLAKGIKPEHAKIDDILSALDRVDQANQRGQIRRFAGNDYTGDLAKGNVWISMAYSGDIGQLKKDNPDLRFVVPEEGAIRFSDNLFMPRGLAHPYAAEAMMNFVYEPRVAAKITQAVGYLSPVKDVQQVLERTDPKLAADPTVFPDAATTRRLHDYTVLDPADERRMNARMQQILGV